MSKFQDHFSSIGRELSDSINRMSRDVSDNINRAARQFSDNIPRAAYDGVTRSMLDLGAAKAAALDSPAIRAAMIGPQLNSPSINAVLGLESLRAAGRLTHLYSNLEASNNALSEAYRFTRDAISRLVEGANEQLRNQLYSVAAESASRITKEFEDMQYGFLREITRSAVFNSGPHNDISRFFDSSLAAILDKPVDEWDEDDFEETLDSIEGFFEKRSKLAPNSRTGFQEAVTILSLALTLISYLHSIISGYQSTEALKGRIADSEKRIVETLKKLIPEKSDETIYVVHRRVVLRASYSNKSEAIAILYPNQTVTLVSRRGKWIRIQYFDFMEGVFHNGWVYKKYLKSNERIAK